MFHVTPTHQVRIDWPRAPLRHQELMDLRTVTKMPGASLLLYQEFEQETKEEDAGC